MTTNGALDRLSYTEKINWSQSLYHGAKLRANLLLKVGRVLRRATFLLSALVESASSSHKDGTSPSHEYESECGSEPLAMICFLISLLFLKRKKGEVWRAAERNSPLGMTHRY